MRRISQDTLIEMLRVIEARNRAMNTRLWVHRRGFKPIKQDTNSLWSDLLYSKGFPEWFVRQLKLKYRFEWRMALRDLRSGCFADDDNTHTWRDTRPTEIRGMTDEQVKDEFERLLQRLAAVITEAAPDDSQTLIRSIEMDGYSVDLRQYRLIPEEGPVSPQEEQSRVHQLLEESRLTNRGTMRKHLDDALELYRAGDKDHSALGEARSFLQSLIEGICEETRASGKHSVGLSPAMRNRLAYLNTVQFFKEDEAAAVGVCWGFLSTGNHSGITSRDETRIGLIMSLEFGFYLLKKHRSWKNGGYMKFVE